VHSQDQKFSLVPATIIAEGTDSPIPNLQIVCYNKYFNQDYLPSSFREKYNLNRKDLYKDKMLIEIFRSDKENKGFDKIELIGITDEEATLTINYRLANSDQGNDGETLAPFVIVQVPKSKKAIRFLVDGVEQGKASKTYIN
jgi:hypothetical protein